MRHCPMGQRTHAQCRAHQRAGVKHKAPKNAQRDSFTMRTTSSSVSSAAAGSRPLAPSLKCRHCTLPLVVARRLQVLQVLRRHHERGGAMIVGKYRTKESFPWLKQLQRKGNRTATRAMLASTKKKGLSVFRR
jgi:hypothetical protein